MTLHIVNQSPQQGDSLSKCLEAKLDSDPLILIEDAVEAILDESKVHINLPTVYILIEHLEQKGIEPPHGSSFQTIDYPGFVDLCAKHSPIISW
ncbi:sulfurtransferase complex subunit TusB [Pseudomaricurvus sp.]|uniref:sulfurtransferase complex subunit TusB n=1 Tax=Pseudomaricurvus sp. TaxID=2004510 RepID=UPI003F6B1399